MVDQLEGSLHNKQQQQHGAGLLTWVAASTYLAALLQGAQVLEACGCAEDAESLLRCVRAILYM
jgi:hypothetical protein